MIKFAGLICKINLSFKISCVFGACAKGSKIGAAERERGKGERGN